MERLLTWLWQLAGILFLLVLGAWAVSKLMGASRAERDALALMTQPNAAPAGRNAFAGLWLMQYDVPTNERDAVMAEDVRRFAAKPLVVEKDAPVPSFESVAKSRYPRIAPDAAARSLLCKPRDNCLTKVRANLPDYVSMIQSNQKYFAQAEQAASGTHLSNPFPPRLDMPMLAFQYAYDPATALATRFAQGDRAAAMAGVCRQVGTWRTHVANTDALIAAMVGNAYLTRGYTTLLADMLAEWSPADALPAECEMALATPSKEMLSMCPVMRGEFALMAAGTTQSIAAQKDQLKTKAFFDEKMTDAARAYTMAPFCEPAGIAAMANDQPLELPPHRGLMRRQCVANAIGCILTQIPGLGYDQYADRYRDQIAVMRAMAGLAWWRGQTALHAKPDEIVQQLPPQFHAAAHPLRYDAKRKALIVPLVYRAKYDADDGEVVLPLPASRVKNN